MNLDQLIATLTNLKKHYGGTLPVVVNSVDSADDWAILPVITAKHYVSKAMERQLYEGHDVPEGIILGLDRDVKKE